MKDASSLARNAIAAATSDGAAQRRKGTFPISSDSSTSPLATIPASRSVFVGPGQTQFTRIPGAKSKATCRVSAITPPFAAE